MKKIISILLVLFFSLAGQILAQEKKTIMKPTTGNNKSANLTYSNHLINEKSPYLLQHAHNPVDWYPWGEEALAKARKENKPIFLSIGYSTCHWCHVMAHESFEDQAVADFLNKYFIAVKVDREERPDIDQIYMTATQMMTGSGGWPMSLFLLPDTRPFYAGTYFPPQKSHGRPGFLELLQLIHKAWENNRADLTSSAEQLTAAIKQGQGDGRLKLNESWLQKGFAQIEDSYEPKYGGFTQSPKFPRPVVMEFLFRYYKSSGIKDSRDMGLHTLDEMADGGMYDHIGGGFHRYSVDGRWRIPHFEKMLYDQGQLASIYLSAWQITGDAKHSNIAREILDYVLRDMRDGAGGFYSAQDADSVNPYNPAEHSEGAYYLWTDKEIDTILIPQAASLFKNCYGIEKDGNALHDPHQDFTGRNILYKTCDLAQTVREAKIDEEELKKILAKARSTLLEQRNKRTPPHLDDKIITAWNGLFISALARAAMILDEERYLRAADKAADFLLTNLMIKGDLKRRWREGESRHPAGLDDYSFMIQGLLDLYQASHSPIRLTQAMELTEKQIAGFTDDLGGFFDTPKSADLLTRMQASHDGAEPSGNSVAALNLLRLGALTGTDKWKQLGEQTIAAFGKTLESYPMAMPLMLAAMDFQMNSSGQIVIVGHPDKADTKALLQEIHSRYLPNTIILLADGGVNQAFLEKRHPALTEMKRVDGRATAYVCENFTCKAPVNTSKALGALLDR